jgi:hypothetical protein
VTSFRGASLIRAPQLESPIGHPKTVRGTLKISLFLVGCVANCGIVGRAADFLERRAQAHGALDRPLEVAIQPRHSV